MIKEKYIYPDQKPNTLLLAIEAPYNRTKSIESYFDEFKNLARTNQVATDHIIYLKLREIDPTYFLTKGKLKDIKDYCDEHKIEEVILSEPLTVQQERNLDDYLRCRIFDRTRLILEIFEKSAHSAEGKIQVELARLQHKKSRLAGKGVNMSQQMGAIGGRGPGETAKERETRHIETIVLRLRGELERIDRARETQRKQRIQKRIPHICLIGYTNAGKSTILNTLTRSNVLAEDKLFATLDTTTRELYVNSKKVGLISDTVGFIQLLPHQLIKAFKSTLSELKYADLLLHVVDVSDLNWESQIEVVHSILEELEVDKQMLYVFNKADKTEITDFLKSALDKYEPHVVINALTKDGIVPLTEYLDQWNTERNPIPEINNYMSDSDDELL